MELHGHTKKVPSNRLAKFLRITCQKQPYLEHNSAESLRGTCGTFLKAKHGRDEPGKGAKAELESMLTFDLVEACGVKDPQTARVWEKCDPRKRPLRFVSKSHL